MILPRGLHTLKFGHVDPALHTIRALPLQVDGKPVGERLRTVARTHARTDGQPENIVFPALSAGLAETQQAIHKTNNNHMGGSVAEWLACWTQAQKGPGSNRSRDAVG